MANKILEKNGVDNTNIDGARFNRFCAGYRDGIIQGSFQEGVLTKINSNTLQLDRAELLISGFRVISDAVEFTFNSFPQNAERYQIVGQIRLDADKQPSFEYAVSRVREIVQNDLFSDNSGDNLYEVLIATFSLDSTGINDVLPILDVITGKSQSNMINVGNVTTEKIDINLPAEVDVDSRYDEETKKHYVDFEFHLPIDLTEIENNTNNALKNSQDAIEKANTATSSVSSAVDAANSAISVANDAKSDASNAISVAEKASTDANNAMTTVQETLDYIKENPSTVVKTDGVAQQTWETNTKVDKVEGKDLSSNDFTDDLLDKLNGIEAGAQVNPTKTSELENDSGFITVDDIPESGLTEEDLSGRIIPENAVNSKFEVDLNGNTKMTLGTPISSTTLSQLRVDGLRVTAENNATFYSNTNILTNYDNFMFNLSGGGQIPLLQVPIRATGDTILSAGGTTAARFAGQIVICTEDSTDGTYKAGHIYKYVDGSTVEDITPETGITEEELAGRIITEGASNSYFRHNGDTEYLRLGRDGSTSTYSELSAGEFKMVSNGATKTTLNAGLARINSTTSSYSATISGDAYKILNSSGTPEVTLSNKGLAMVDKTITFEKDSMLYTKITPTNIRIRSETSASHTKLTGRGLEFQALNNDIVVAELTSGELIFSTPDAIIGDSVTNSGIRIGDIPIKLMATQFDNLDESTCHDGQLIICTEDPLGYGTYLPGHMYRAELIDGTFNFVDITPVSEGGTQTEINSLSILSNSGQSAYVADTYFRYNGMKGLVDDREISVNLQLPIRTDGVLKSTATNHNGTDCVELKVSTSNTVSEASTDNTVPTSKAVYTAIQGANSYTDTKVADLVGTAPETLDTLQEVAQAIQDNEDVVSALNSAIGSKANQSALDTTNTNVSNLTTRVANVETEIADKVDKVDGKGLSTNDFTTALLTKLNGIAAGAQVNPTKLSELTNDSGFITASAIPTVPTKTSQLTNDSGFLTSAPVSSVAGYTGAVATSTLVNEILRGTTGYGDQIVAYAWTTPTGYIKFKSGLQICWGRASGSSDGNQTASYAQPFVTVFTVVGSGYSGSSANASKTWEHDNIFNVGTSSFQWYRADSFSLYYIAIGIA